MAVDYESIGANIKMWRVQKMISQEELGRLVYVNNQHISRIETGKVKLSLELLILIANALEVSADELLSGNIAHTGPHPADELNITLVGFSEEQRTFLKKAIIMLKELLMEMNS